MIFPCDYAYTYQFVVFKNIKSVLKTIFLKNNKNGSTAAWHGGRGLPP
jgi:hypothetical protein